MATLLKALGRARDAWFKIGLVARICLGIVVGIAWAHICPGDAFAPLLGELFVRALRGVAPILVFLLVVASFAQNAGKLDKRFGVVILFYLLSTALASAVSVAACRAFPLELALNVESVACDASPSNVLGVVKNLVLDATQNPIEAIAQGKYVAILFWAVVLGLALKRVGSSETKRAARDLANAATTAVRWVVECAPFGVMGIVCATISSHGFSAFATYGRLLATLVGCMLFVALVSNPLIAFLATRRNPYPLLFRCLRTSGLTAFFTRSSAANIPVNLQLCEDLQVDRSLYSISIPLGATINMNGAAATIVVMTLAAAHTLGLEVDLPSALVLSVLSSLAACGASGVAGGSLLLIPTACSLFGIPSEVAAQVVGVGFVVGVVQDGMETALNSSGDAFFTAVADWRAKMN